MLFLFAEDLPDTAGMFAANDVINHQVSLWQGDITLLQVDAVVNAANSELAGGSGGRVLVICSLSSNQFDDFTQLMELFTEQRALS